jgi:hypothetical protein
MNVIIIGGEVEIQVDGRTFRVDPASGLYDELIEAPPAAFENNEPANWRCAQNVERYAEMYQAGSPFPPLCACGLTPNVTRYRLVNGNHRLDAARLVGAPTISAWVCSYVSRGIGADGEPIWMPARLSETAIGRRIAAVMGMEWCPRCKGFLNYTSGDALCKSCELDDEVRTRYHDRHSRQKDANPPAPMRV